MKKLAALVIGMVMTALSGCSADSAMNGSSEIQANAAVDAWHRAAATGDLRAYQNLMTRDVVFLGTDKTERWVGDEFINFCRPYFDGPKPYGEGAWTYEPIERHLEFADDLRTAWFDERLVNQAYGNCRGTGVLRSDDGDRWRVAHYSLTFLVPNGVAKGIVGQIQAYEASEEGTD